jgi:hypothetical protein
MATLSDIADLATWPKFVRAVKSAMVTAAVQVGAEIATPGSETHRLRHALSAKVLSDPDAWAQQFAWAAAANPALTYTSTDNDIQFTVNSIWSAMAGVLPEA